MTEQVWLQYRYIPEEAGLKEFPLGHIRLAGFEETRDPLQADCFVLPCDVRHVTNEQIVNLPYLAGNVARHVFFSISEHPRRILPFDCAIVFRTDNCEMIARANPSTITWAWGVDDLIDYMPLPVGGFRYDVCFQGWRSTELTDRACKSIQRAGLKAHVAISDRFHGHIETDATNGVPGAIELRNTLRASFLKTMSESRLSLCPRSKPEGVARWRLYEAMSMGRITVHLCDGFVPPLADRIDWSKCQLQIAERDVERTGEIIAEWLAAHSDGELIECGAYARAMWTRWFDNRKWEITWAELVRERLSAL